MSTTTILTVLGLLAIVFAVNAIRRVQAKRVARLESPAQSVSNSGTDVASNIPTSSRSPASVRDTEIQQSSATVTAPDRSLEPETTSPQATEPSEASSSSPQPDPAPLAASLSVSELVQPDDATSTAEQQITHEVSSSKTDSHEHHALLDEIADLGRSATEQPDPKLLQYADHSDAAIRAAVAFALGDAADRSGQPPDEIVSVLDRLSNDPDLQVRTRAAAALGKIGIASGMVQSDASEGIQFS